MLAVELFGCQKLHLIYTDDDSGYGARNLDAFRARLANRFDWLQADDAVVGIRIEDTRAGLRTITQQVQLIQRQPDDLLIDATPGKRVMQLAMAEAVQPGDRMLCWFHEFDSQSRRPKPFTVEPLLCCLLYTSPSPRDQRGSRMPSSA